MIRSALRAMWVTGLLWIGGATAQAEDWPQWMGPQRDNVWRETGVATQLPSSANPMWSVSVGLGYAGPAVAAGRVYIGDYEVSSGRISNNPGARDTLEGKERLLCLDAETGQRLWIYEYARRYELSYPEGPRCTPTVVDGKVYFLGAMGDFACLNAETGEVVWKKDLMKEYGVNAPLWGFSSHPLVVGDLVMTLVGGEGSVAVAWNRHTGKEAWRALTSSEPGYSPPTLIRFRGREILVIWDAESIHGMEAESGRVLWSLPLKPSYGMSIATPRQFGDTIFACGMGDAALLLRLEGDGDQAKEVWRGKASSAMYCSNSTPIIDQGVIYGNDCRAGQLVAADMADGKRLWESQEPLTQERKRLGHGTVHLVKHQDRFVLFGEQGDLIFADLSRDGYKELSRVNVIEPTTEVFGRKVAWAPPAFALRSVFARNDAKVVRVSLAQ